MDNINYFFQEIEKSAFINPTMALKSVKTLWGSAKGLASTGFKAATPGFSIHSGIGASKEIGKPIIDYD